MGLIVALALLLLSLFLLVFNVGNFRSVPGSMRLSIGVGTIILLVNLSLAIYIALRSQKLPFLVRVLPVIAAILFVIGFGNVIANSVAFEQGQKPSFTIPGWFLFATLIFSQSGELIRRYWEKPNKQAWLRVTRAAIIGAVILLAFLFLYISLMSPR